MDLVIAGARGLGLTLPDRHAIAGHRASSAVLRPGLPSARLSLRDEQRRWRGADPHEVTRGLAAVLRASTGR